MPLGHRQVEYTIRANLPPRMVVDRDPRWVNDAVDANENGRIGLALKSRSTLNDLGLIGKMDSKPIDLLAFQHRHALHARE